MEITDLELVLDINYGPSHDLIITWHRWVFVTLLPNHEQLLLLDVDLTALCGYVIVVDFLEQQFIERLLE